jgi:Spy/CpxP family protein refolding chaperone
MSKLRTWQTIVIVLLLINSAVLVILWFKPKDQRHPVPMGDVKNYLTNELELNAQQRKQYEFLRTEHFALIEALEKEFRILRDQFFENIPKPVADSALIKSLSQKMFENRSKKEEATLYHFRKLRSILNKEQQTKFDNIIQDVLKSMGRRPMPGKRPHPP